MYPTKIIMTVTTQCKVEYRTVHTNMMKSYIRYWWPWQRRDFLKVNSVSQVRMFGGRLFQSAIICGKNENWWAFVHTGGRCSPLWDAFLKFLSTLLFWIGASGSTRWPLITWYRAHSFRNLQHCCKVSRLQVEIKCSYPAFQLFVTALRANFWTFHSKAVIIPLLVRVPY